MSSNVKETPTEIISAGEIEVSSSGDEDSPSSVLLYQQVIAQVESIRATSRLSRVSIRSSKTSSRQEQRSSQSKVVAARTKKPARMRRDIGNNIVNRTINHPSEEENTAWTELLFDEDVARQSQQPGEASNETDLAQDDEMHHPEG